MFSVYRHLQVNLSKPLFLGDPDTPKIALTFDDGPDDTVTPLLLDVLKKHGVKATFFCLGACVNAHRTSYSVRMMRGTRFALTLIGTAR